MWKSSLGDFSNVYILVNGTITITGTGADDAVIRLSKRNKAIVFRIFKRSSNCYANV